MDHTHDVDPDFPFVEPRAIWVPEEGRWMTWDDYCLLRDIQAAAVAAKVPPPSHRTLEP